MLVVAAASDSSQLPKSLRIFVVENHADTLKYLCMYLEMLGHSVASANSMTGALAKLPHFPCDVLLCDINLPDGSGWELLPLIDAQLPLPTYAVAMSGWVGREMHDHSEAAGFHHHLDKPVTPIALEAVLNHAASALDSLSRNGVTSFDELH